MLPRSLVIAELDRTGMQYLGRIETMDLPEVRFISLTDNAIEELPSLRELTKLEMLYLVREHAARGPRSRTDGRGAARCCRC